MMSPTEEDFELELRSLSGVLNVEIRHRENGDVDAVTLIVHGQDTAAIRVMATQIVNLYYTEATVIVEDASRALSPRESQAPRVSLVRSEFCTDTAFCDVELSFSGRIGIGREWSALWRRRSHARGPARPRIQRSLLPVDGDQCGHQPGLARHRHAAPLL
jgi:hypothetical protein